MLNCKPFRRPVPTSWRGLRKVIHRCTKRLFMARLQKSKRYWFQTVIFNSDYARPNNFLFLPKMENRNHANRTFQRMFNYVLDNHGLKLDQDGQPRTTYSLRHYALQTRRNKSGGKVNIYDLARNAGTSVNQLERFYLKRMKVSQKQRERLNRFDSTE